MPSARFAWGIDIGNRALKAVKLVRDGDGFAVDEFEVIEHETVLSNAGDNKESLIQTAIASFVQRHPMKGGIVGVGVSGQSSFARFIKLPPVEPKKIPEIVRFEAIQQIPFPLDDVEWSYQLFQSPESPDVEVGIFAMRKELVNQHIRYFTDVDLNVQVVQMNPLAVYNALRHDGAFEGGTTMVIDLGAENTDLLIADNETIWMRSIPIGGNNFTETLVKAFKLPFAKAEDLKRNSATSKYARQIFQAMRPIFADLVAEIQRSVGFYASVHRDSRIKKVIALGGTFRLPGLQKYLQQNLQMEVERLDKLGAGGPSDPKLVPAFNENMLSLVSAYGLALQTLGDTKVTSSLLPAKIRREKMWQEKTKWFAAAAALFVLGAAMVTAKWLVLNLQQGQAHADYAAKIGPIKSEALSLDSRWSNIENFGSEDRTKYADLLKLDKYRGMWRNMIVDLYNALPTPQPEVASGDPVQMKKIKRSDRRVILIERWDTRPVAQIEPIVKDANFVRWASSETGSAPSVSTPPAGGENNGAPPPADNPALGNGVVSASSRGFLMTIHCTTPYAKAVAEKGMIYKDLTNALLAIKPDANRPKMEYAVARVAVVSVTPLGRNETRKQQMRMQWDAAMRAAAAQNFGGTPATPGHPAPVPNENDAFKDPLLDESVLDDLEITLLVAVTLDPPNYTGSTASPQASAGQ